MDTKEQKGIKAAERTKKRRPDDRLIHWVSCRVAIISPKFPVCKALKEKIKSTRERSSRCVAEWFRDVVVTQLDLVAKKIFDLEAPDKNKDQYIPPHKRIKPKVYEGGTIEEILFLILHKVEDHDTVLNEIEENVSLLNEMIASLFNICSTAGDPNGLCVVSYLPHKSRLSWEVVPHIN
uniref:Uncharacterized protein n=1 Tax=Solanum tuberosum TaxID=4113 RepID=M1D9S4_SOLTU